MSTAGMDSYIHQLRDLIGVRAGRGNRGYAPIQVSMRSAASSTPTADEITRAIPSGSYEENLLNTYWRVFHPLYPFFDKERFSSLYHDMINQKPPQVDQRVFLATLNVMCALAIQSIESLSEENMEYESKRFFDIAQDILPFGTDPKYTPEEIRYFLLLSLFFQSTGRLDLSRVAVLSAIGVARRFGLHVPGYENVGDLRSRERAKLLWHGCILMDRITSITLGMPSAITSRLASIVPLPQTRHIISSNEADVAQPIDKEATDALEFFVISTKLFEVMNSIMVAIRHPAPIMEDLIAAMRLDDCLSRIQSALPSHLRLGSLDVPEDELSFRKAVVLRARFLQARILLFRPMLARFGQSGDREVESASQESITDRMVQQCALACVESAREMVTMLFTLQGKSNVLPPWWCRVHYLHTAATVILGGVFLRNKITLIPSTPCLWLLYLRVTAALGSLTQFGSLAKRSSVAIRFLSERILRELRKIEDGHLISTAGEPADSPLSTAGVNAEEPSEGVGSRRIDFDFVVEDYYWLTSMPGSVLY